MCDDRPIADAALQLEALCASKDDKNDDQIWQLGELLFGEDNVSLWKKYGGKRKIVEMLYKNYDVLRTADTTGIGFYARFMAMWLTGDFESKDGNDLIILALKFGDDKMMSALNDLIFAKMGISKRVASACASAYIRKGEELIGRLNNLY